MRLDPGEAERIAELVAAAIRREPPARFLDAAAVARMLSVEREWVYEHAVELGAVRLGGARGRLRFDRDALCRRMAGSAERGLAGGGKPDTPSTDGRRRKAERPMSRGRRSRARREAGG